MLNVVVEIPKGSANKYEYDPELDAFVLDRPLYASVHYPGDYGFVPGTLSKDGDPLDVLVLLETPTFPGCVVRTRIIGLLAIIDQNSWDGKLLGVSVNEPRTANIRDISDLEPHRLREIEFFFSTYKTLEGKKTVTREWRHSKEALDSVVEASERYDGKHRAPG